MNTTKTPIRVNIILIILILGLVAFVLYFYFFINPSQVVGILSRTNLAYYSLAFVSYFLFALFSGLVWHN